MITKQGNKYKLDIRPEGVKGKRIIKLFKYKCDAVLYQNQLVSRLLENQGEQPKVDNRQLQELIEIWYELHGRSLKSSIDTKNRLLKLSEILGNPIAQSLSSVDIAHYRKLRIGQGISESTLNRELITLKALFRELKRMSVITYDSDVLVIRKLRETKTELSYLTDEQIETLMHQVTLSSNTSLLYVVLICLVTGSRWSEAENLTLRNCFNSGLSFENTKNGQSRFIPLSSSHFKWIQNRLAQGSFSSCYSAFRSAFERCNFTVPKGQLAHILRHTFASHFIMNGGNIRTLQTILGHSSLQMTMRYTHLAPDYMNQAKQLNPLSSGKIMESLITDIKKPVDHKA